jgi:hypothetical protein
MIEYEQLNRIEELRAINLGYMWHYPVFGFDSNNEIDFPRKLYDRFVDRAKRIGRKKLYAFEESHKEYQFLALMEAIPPLDYFEGVDRVNILEARVKQPYGRRSSKIRLTKELDFPGDDLIYLGCDTGMEIWKKPDWLEYEKEYSKNFTKIAEELFDKRSNVSELRKLVIGLPKINLVRIRE